MPDKFGKIEEPLDILVEYGYLDDPNIPYHRALNIAVNDFSNDQKLGGDENREILEILQKEARKELKLRRKKIDVSKFFGKKETETETDTTGTSDLAVRSKTQSIDTKKFIPEPTEEKGGALAEILTGVNSIVETLKAGQKQDKKQQDFLRINEERSKRKKKEGKLEFKVFDGLKKTATKLLAPMKSAWQKMLDFLGKVILGRVLFKILEWMGDKDNHGKLKSIIKFFEDWWPAMLAGYLLFGNSLTSMVTGLLAKMAMWLAPMLGAIAKLMLNPWVAAAMVLGVGGVLAHQQIKKNRQEFDEQDDDSTLTVEEFQEDNEGIENPNEQTADIQPSQGYAETGSMPGMMNFNKGGTVPGSGNIDTVPAMLTPGEFVMSKGAVQKYGSDTLAGMNAAAGGTNIPTFSRGRGEFNEGGVITDPEVKKQQEAYMLKFVNEERAMQGLEPLNNLTYAPGVELTKMIGPGPRTTETSDTFTDLDKGIKTKFDTKTMGDQSIMRGSIGQTTEEDRQKFFTENPHAAQLLNIKNQMELDKLGGDISASARMNGGGLVQNFKNGGLVKNLRGGTDRLIVSRYNGGGLVKNYNSGGLVQNFNEGGKVGFFGGIGNIMGGKKWSGESREQIGRGVSQANIAPKNTSTVITPSEKKKVTVAYQEEKKKSDTKKNQNNSEQKIPNFNVTASRSPQKIKVLGISV